MCSSAVRVGTKVDIITYVKSSSRTTKSEIRNFGQRGVVGIGFVYEHSSYTLILKVKSDANNKGWIPCSDTYDASPNAVETGNIFAHEGHMMIVVQCPGGTRAKVACIDNPNQVAFMNTRVVSAALEQRRYNYSMRFN
jgi:hypothetical protein